ncbi:MAG: TolC family protein, partial [Magnetococcales bacterium]|nr:TolC family protein [Magnetococcales bacterium]
MSVILGSNSVFLSKSQPALFRVLASSTLVLVLGLSGCTVKPEPISNQEVEKRVRADLGRLFAHQEPVSLRVGLHEAMARAVKYNLQRRVKQMEEALAVEDLAVAKKDLLPKTAVHAGYTMRNKENVTTLQNSNLKLLNQDNEHSVAGLTWTWSLLDFGVSYVHARQKADEVLVYREKRRKSTQLLIHEVRTRYWQAAMTDQIIPKLDQLLKEAKLARDNLLRMEAAGQEVPAIALEGQQVLLDTTHKLWDMRRKLIESKSELAVLMNLPPGTKFMLAAQGGEELKDDLVYLPVLALDQYALLNRSELRSEDYKERISALEVRKVLLKMLPNISFLQGYGYDSNNYLQNQSWNSVGTQISWDLFNLTSTPQRLKLAKLGKEVVRTRRLAFSMAAITQLRIALQSYHISKRDLSIASDLNMLQVRKVQQIENDRNNLPNYNVKSIEQRALALISQVEQGLSYAQMQSDLGRIHLTLGVDPLPLSGHVDIADIQTTTRLLAMRQDSVTSAVISAIPSTLLNASPTADLIAETDTGSLAKGDASGFWNLLEKFSDKLDDKKNGGGISGSQPVLAHAAQPQQQIAQPQQIA